MKRLDLSFKIEIDNYKQTANMIFADILCKGDTMNIEIKSTFEHYEVYIDGKFSFSADTLKEVDEELNYMKENNNGHL